MIVLLYKLIYVGQGLGCFLILFYNYWNWCWYYNPLVYQTCVHSTFFAIMSDTFCEAKYSKGSPLREKCPDTELFWFEFSRIRTEYGDILRISTYSVRMRENKDQKKLRIWTHFTQCSFVLHSLFKLKVSLYFPVNILWNCCCWFICFCKC